MSSVNPNDDNIMVSAEAAVLPADPAPIADTKTESSEPSLDKRLERIEASLEHIDEQLNKKTQPNKSMGKGALAAAFGFLGFKIGGVLGAKIGITVDFSKAALKHGSEGLEDLGKLIIPWGQKNAEINKASVKWTIAGSIIGGVVVGIGGAVLGWRSGDRLDSPSDLFTHPIDSLKKMLTKPTKDDSHSSRPVSNTVTEENPKTIANGQKSLEGKLVSNRKAEQFL